MSATAFQRHRDASRAATDVVRTVAFSRAVVPIQLQHDRTEQPSHVSPHYEEEQDQEEEEKEEEEFYTIEGQSRGS